jgi:hypothetical protein
LFICIIHLNKYAQYNVVLLFNAKLNVETEIVLFLDAMTNLLLTQHATGIHFHHNEKVFVWKRGIL